MRPNFPAIERELAKPDLDPQRRKLIEEFLEQYRRTLELNPLEGFHPHSLPQKQFLEAWTPIVAAFAGNRFGKCCHVDTPVRMADGSVRRLGAIYPGDWVVGVNMDGTTSPARVLEWVDQGVKDVYEHRFSKRGAEASFVATADHKMLARPESTNGCDKGNRIVPAGEVRARWVAQRQLGFDPGDSGDPDEEHALLVGLLLGDGYTAGPVLQFSCADPDIEELAREEAGKLECALAGNPANPINFRVARPGPRGTPNPAKQLVRRLGFDCLAHEKRLPRQAQKWSNLAVARLIAGLFLTDGCVTTCDGVTRVSYSSVSRLLVEGIKGLLEQRFGIYGSEVTGHERAERRTEYVFSVGNYASMARFAQAVPLVGRKRDLLEKAMATWPGKRSDGAGLVFREHRYLGKAPTCDIVIDNDTHLFALANGLVVSNTAALVVKCLIQHTSDEWLPSHLRGFKFAKGKPVMGRMLVPSEKAFIEYTEPALKRWCPKALYLNGSWDKAWSKQHWILRFDDGGQLSIYTYNADPTTMVGSALDYVAYDEPPPEGHRRECLARLMDRDGRELYALTPVNMTGGGIGWLYRTIWKRRQEPGVTVVKASTHDNPLLSPAAVERVLSEYPEEERQAREYGDFLHFGGMVYVGGFEQCLVPPLTPKQLEGRDIVVGVDPGLKKAAFTWHAFDRDNRVVVFDECVVEEGTPADYVVAVALKNATWGIGDLGLRDSALEILKEQLRAGEIPSETFHERTRTLREARSDHGRPLYVIDPSARNRSLTNAESVEAALARYRLVAVHGQNNVEAGVQQIRARKQRGMYFVCENCTGLREEAEEYRMKDRPDGVFEVVKENDHELDSDRYAVMARPWNPPPYEPKDKPRSMFESWPPNLPKEAVPPTGALT